MKIKTTKIYYEYETFKRIVFSAHNFLFVQ